MSAIEDKNTQKEYAAMLGGNTDLMNKEIIGKYLETTDEEIEQIAKDLGLTKEELAANMGVSVADLATKFEELADSANDAFIVAETKIKGITGTDAIPEAFNQASAGDLESYAQLLG
jgi:DNA-binding transcriptional regulator YiaG